MTKGKMEVRTYTSEYVGEAFPRRNSCGVLVSPQTGMGKILAGPWLGI
jgi:hypothetical protein